MRYCELLSRFKEVKSEKISDEERHMVVEYLNFYIRNHSNTVSERLQIALAIYGKTIAEVGKEMHCSRQSVQNWCSDKSKLEPDYLALYWVSSKSGIDLDWLMNGGEFTFKI